MNTTPASNNRYVIILTAVLIAVFLVLAFNVVIWLSLMNGGMMGMGGMMNYMMGARGQMTDQMIQACQDMMQNIQQP